MWEFVRDEDSATYDSFVLSRDVQEAHRSKVKGRHTKVKGHHFDRTPDGYQTKHTPEDEVLKPYENVDEL